MTQIGVSVRESGAAIVTIEHRPGDAVVTGIERLPFDLEALAEQVEALAAQGRPELVVDEEGLGSALWAALRGLRLRSRARWRLYSARGVERQQLVDTLLVAIHESRLHFAPRLAQQDPMSRALVAYRRQVREDGLIGSELVVALCLALLRQRRQVGAFVA